MSNAAPSTLLVCSGKGGVGTSIVCALAGLAAAERGERVLLIDASESNGTLHMLFGARPTHSLWMLSVDGVEPSETLIPLGGGLTLISGGTSGGAFAPGRDEDRRAALTRVASLYENYDLVIFDGGSRLDTITAISDLASPSLLIVTAADRLALAANYALMKSAFARTRDVSIFVVANRHAEHVAAEACGFLTGACSHFLERSIAIVGAIPDDPCLHAAVGAGMTVRDALDGSPAADTMREVLARVIPSHTPVPAPARPAITPRMQPSFPASSSSTRLWS